MTRQVTERAKALAREFEGFRDRAYLCPADVWTIGYGHTLAVREGQTCTKRQAELWLDEDFATAAREVERVLGPAIVAELTDNQHDALCDFVFNLGPQPKATLWVKIRAKDFDAVPAQLARWVYAGKTKLNGLVRRRNAEIVLWSEAEPGSDDVEVSSAETRYVETPPAPAPKPLLSQAITAATAAVATVPVAAQKVQETIAPYAGHSQAVQQVVGLLAAIGAGAAVALLGLTWLQHRRAKH